MARPTASQELAESTEYLKRRFIRQNRELARINAAQAIQIRTIEAETSRLLAENIALRERLIHFEREPGRQQIHEGKDAELTLYDETRALRPDRITPEKCLETINEEKTPTPLYSSPIRMSPNRVSLIRKPPLRKKSAKRRSLVVALPQSSPVSESPAARDSPVPDPPVMEPSECEQRVEDPLSAESPSRDPIQQASTVLEPITHVSPGRELPLHVSPNREPASQKSPVREPLAPKTRRGARVSYVEPSLKKKMRRSNIYANAVATG